MPRYADADQRRRQVAEALFRVVEAEGLDAASLPRIARELNATTGLLQKYFRSKDELLLFALRHLTDELSVKVLAALHAEGGLRDRLHAALCEIAMIAGSGARARVWLAFLARAAASPALHEEHVTSSNAIRDMFRRVLEKAGRDGGEAVALLAFVDGVTAHRALEPDVMTTEVARRVLAGYLARIWGDA